MGHLSTIDVDLRPKKCIEIEFNFAARNFTTMANKKPKDYRSAKTGRYVTEAYAVKHPSTTVAEARKKRKKSEG